MRYLSSWRHGLGLIAVLNPGTPQSITSLVTLRIGFRVVCGGEQAHICNGKQAPAQQPLQLA